MMVLPVLCASKSSVFFQQINNWPCNLCLCNLWPAREHSFSHSSQTSIKGETFWHGSWDEFLFTVSRHPAPKNKKDTAFAKQHSTSWNDHWCQTVSTVGISSHLPRSLHPSGWSNAAQSWNCWIFMIQTTTRLQLWGPRSKQHVSTSLDECPLDGPSTISNYTSITLATAPLSSYCCGILWTNVACSFVNSKL